MIRINEWTGLIKTKYVNIDRWENQLNILKVWII